jgi:hypothetical protein
MFDAAYPKTCSGMMLRVNPFFLSTHTILHRESAQADCGVRSAAYAEPEHAEYLLRQFAQAKTLVLEHDPGSLEETGFAQAGRRTGSQSIFLASAKPCAITFRVERRANASRELGCLTIPFVRSRQRNAARPASAFRHASSLPLWDLNFPHCAARAIVGPRPDVPGCVAQRWTKLPLIGAVQHPQAAADGNSSRLDPFAERGTRCFSSFQRARPRGDAPTVPCGQALQATVRRRDPRRRLDLIPRNQRAADRRPRSQHAPTLTANRNQTNV